MDTPSTLAPFPLLPTLETFRIRQATFVDPWRMVEVILGLAGASLSPAPSVLFDNVLYSFSGGS